VTDLLPSATVFAIAFMGRQVLFLGGDDWLTVAGPAISPGHFHMAAGGHGGSLIVFG